MEFDPLLKSLKKRSLRLLLLSLFAITLPVPLWFVLPRLARSSVFRILLNPENWTSPDAYFGAAFLIVGILLGVGIGMIVLGCITWRKSRAVGRTCTLHGLNRPLLSRFSHVIGLLTFILGIILTSVGLILLLIVLVLLGVVMNLG